MERLLASKKWVGLARWSAKPGYVLILSMASWMGFRRRLQVIKMLEKIKGARLSTLFSRRSLASSQTGTLRKKANWPPMNADKTKQSYPRSSAARSLLALRYTNCA